MRSIECDYDFANTYMFQMTKGRYFSKEHPSDSTSVVINQMVEKVLNVKDIVGKYLISPGKTKTAEEN